MNSKNTKSVAKPKTSNDHQWQFDFLIDQFGKESDRAAVILAVSIIDEVIGTLIKVYLVPTTSSSDSLFDSATSPLSNFSSKIVMAYRLGLISTKMCRDIHIMRKIRNSFAHDIYGCNFENGSVKSRIRELETSIKKSLVDDMKEIERDDDLLDGTRGLFLYIAACIIWILTDLIKNTNEIKTCELEWMYE